jgi:hypothetical protein
MLNNETDGRVYKDSLWQRIVLKKFSAPIVIVFVLLCSLAISFVIATEGLDIAIFILCGLIAIPVIYAVVALPDIAIVILILLSFFINLSSRFLPEPTPIGLVLDVVTYLLILGFFVRQKKEHNWSYFNNTITYFVLIWVGYNIFEIFNPASPTLLEWVFTVRTVGFIMLMYFIFLFHIRSKEYIRFLFKLWLVLELIAALSAFQQEHFGLLPFETNWLYREPGRYQLLFIGGHLRKWGIFSDPVVFAFNMVAGCMMCISLMLGNIKTYKKVILGALCAFFFTVLLYSGTRSSYVLVPAALAMVVILNFNMRLFIVTIFLGLALGAMIVVPTRNPTIARFQSAFKPAKDRSFEERAKNQAFIKPYILSHPIGWGLGSVGIWGQRFAPDSFLAKFPPDSGYVRIAVEMGYVGLFLYCLFNFIVLYKGITYYYFMKDPELKSYCLAMVLILFTLDIGNYPQQSTVQYPTNILYFMALALINTTRRLDLEQRQAKPGLTAGEEQPENKNYVFKGDYQIKPGA